MRKALPIIDRTSTGGGPSNRKERRMCGFLFVFCGFFLFLIGPFPLSVMMYMHYILQLDQAANPVNEHFHRKEHTTGMFLRQHAS